MYKLHAVKVPYETVADIEATTAKDALDQYRRLIKTEDVEYVSLAIANLHNYWYKSTPQARVQTGQYRYNGVGKIAEWRQIKVHATDGFKKRYPSVWVGER